MEKLMDGLGSSLVCLAILYASTSILTDWNFASLSLRRKIRARLTSSLLHQAITVIGFPLPIVLVAQNPPVAVGFGLTTIVYFSMIAFLVLFCWLIAFLSFLKSLLSLEEYYKLKNKHSHELLMAMILR